MRIPGQGRGRLSGLRPCLWHPLTLGLDSQTPEMGVDADDGGRERYSDQHPPPSHRAPRTGSQRQSSFLQETPLGGSIRCPLSAGPGAVRPSPQHHFRITPPPPHTQVHHEGLDSGPQTVLEGRRETVPESVGELGGEQAPHLAPEGREEGDLTNPEPPTLLTAHLGLSVWVGSQTEDTASAPSQRAESAEGLEAQRPFPGCPLIPLGPAWVPGKPALYLKPQPPPRPHRSPPPRSSGTGY